MKNVSRNISEGGILIILYQAVELLPVTAKGVELMPLEEASESLGFPETLPQDRVPSIPCFCTCLCLQELPSSQAEGSTPIFLHSVDIHLSFYFWCMQE